MSTTTENQVKEKAAGAKTEPFEISIVTKNLHSRVILGYNEEYGFYVLAYHGDTLESHAASCWSEKKTRSAGLTYNPQAPLLMALWSFMKSVGFAQEAMEQARIILTDYGVHLITAGSPSSEG